VNNAGIMLLSSIAEATDELIDRQIDTNLKGVLNGMREAAKRLRNGGRIIIFHRAWSACINQRTPSTQQLKQRSKP
jgi:NAD(P)-dependent dehydrogenase (short-subunit alcohol dehydrogenase family)